MGGTNLHNYDLDKTMSELFNLNPTEYKEIAIRNLDLNNTVIDELRRINVLYLSDMLLLSSKDLLNVRTLGMGKLNKLYDFFSDLKNGNIDIAAYKISSIHNVPLTIALNREKIINGDFSSVDVSKNNEKIISKYFVAQKTIGQELANISTNNPQYILSIVQSLSTFHQKQSIIINKRKSLTGLMYSIKNNRRIQKVDRYIDIYPSNINDRQVLKRIYCRNDVELTPQEIDKIVIDSKEYNIVIAFLSWLFLSPQYYINNLMKKVLNNPLKKRIIKLRIDNYSFLEIAEIVKYNQEVVIKKHNEVIKSFFASNDSLAAFLLLSLDLNKKYFSIAELTEEFGEITPILFYLYKNSNNSRIETNNGYLIVK